MCFRLSNVVAYSSTPGSDDYSLPECSPVPGDWDCGGPRSDSPVPASLISTPTAAEERELQ